ncbi:hypothetical protein [Bosea sp. LjRoot237]|uniref:hypothetical protein n=1 Tax=Bosea sp. LjRoot237 TaxID=3342292 RepID=UPI003ECDDB30
MSGSRKTLIALCAGSLVGVLATIAAVDGKQGSLDQIFRTAWHDSWNTDLTGEVASLLRVGKQFENVVQFIEDNGFSCQRSMLDGKHDSWFCERGTWNWGYLAYERWTIEFQCDATLPKCTIDKHKAAVESLSWHSFI